MLALSMVQKIKTHILAFLPFSLTFFRTVFVGLLCLFITGCVSKEPSSKERAAELKMEIGVSHLGNNNLPLALKELLEAHQLDPHNPYICNNLGIVYFLRERYELSEKYFSQAVSLKPTFTDAKNNLARVYIEKKDYAKALNLLDEVSSDLTYTNMDGANFNYGLLYFEQKNYAQAKIYFTKALKNNRQDCLTQVYYARSFMDSGEVQPASAQLDKALPLCVQVGADDAHFYSAIAYYRLGLKQKSLSRFQEINQIFPQGKHSLRASQMIQLIQKELR